MGTWNPLAEDTVPPGWSVTCWWLVLGSDSGARQRLHHPWAEPGCDGVRSKALSEGADCRETLFFMALLLLLTPVLLTPVLPLPSKHSPHPLSFSIHPILSGLFLRKGKMPQVPQGIPKGFTSLQPFTARKKIFVNTRRK